MLPCFKIALIHGSLQTKGTLRYLSEIASQISEISGNLHCDTLNIEDISPTRLSEYQAIVLIHVDPESFANLLPEISTIPCVSIDENYSPKLPFPQIIPENTAIGHLCGEFFLDKGLQHFAFVVNSKNPSGIEQLKGFKEAVELTGHKCSSWIFNETKNFLDTSSLEGQPDFLKWLQNLPKPLGLVIPDEVIAHEFIPYCNDLGISIPEEVLLLSIGNDPLICGLSCPAISSVELDYRSAARMALKTVYPFATNRINTNENKIVIEPVDIVQRRSTDAQAVTNGHVARAILIIHEFATSGITVEEVASKINVSRSYLERSFRQQLGRSPGSEIRRTKLILVKKLLHNTELSVVEIAEKTGFEHPEYLYVAFKRRFRMTPIQYRRRIAQCDLTSISPSSHANDGQSLELQQLACA